MQILQKIFRVSMHAMDFQFQYNIVDINNAEIQIKRIVNWRLLPGDELVPFIEDNADNNWSVRDTKKNRNKFKQSKIYYSKA